MPDPDPLDIPEPTADEIAAAAEQEAKDARTLAKKAPAKTAGRGPGRPPGSKNKTPAAKEATSRATATTTSSAAPKGLPAARPATELDKLARDRKKADRDKRVAELVGEAEKHTFSFVSAVGMVTGLPNQYLMAPESDAKGNTRTDQLGQPILSLTPYGQALAPKTWQVKTCVEAYVRAEETDAGQKMLAQFDRAMPYLLMLGAVAALGTYTVSTMQVAGALKEMIHAEIAQAAANSSAPEPPDASGGAKG